MAEGGGEQILRQCRFDAVKRSNWGILRGWEALPVEILRPNATSISGIER
jgi:hypothetical protein